jgi:competence ComEA-like helix-hairpin-helix protein
MNRKNIFLLLLIFIPASLFATDKININTATLEQLDELVGIGPKYAQAIIDARPFSSVDDLLRVKGIGEKTLQKIKEQGLACVDCQAEITNPTSVQATTQIQNPTPASTSSVKTLEPVDYPDGIIFNEILPSPEGADETEEWIEIYNQNGFEVDLSGWQIKDQRGGIKTYTFPQGSKIIANGYLLLARPETKITLNNDEDGLILLSPDKKQVDTVAFGKAPTGESYNRTDADWAWSSNLTPGQKNSIITPSANQDNSKKENIFPSPSSQNKKIEVESPSADNDEGNTASAIESLSNKKGAIILVALILALLSAGALLYLKKSLTSEN